MTLSKVTVQLEAGSKFPGKWQQPDVCAQLHWEAFPGVIRLPGCSPGPTQNHSSVPLHEPWREGSPGRVSELEEPVWARGWAAACHLSLGLPLGLWFTYLRNGSRPACSKN